MNRRCCVVARRDTDPVRLSFDGDFASSQCHRDITPCHHTLSVTIITVISGDLVRSLSDCSSPALLTAMMIDGVLTIAVLQSPSFASIGSPLAACKKPAAATVRVVKPTAMRRAVGNSFSLSLWGTANLFLWRIETGNGNVNSESFVNLFWKFSEVRHDRFVANRKA